MSPFTALDFAAREILALNESLPVVMLATHDGMYVTAYTQGDRITFRADLLGVTDMDLLSRRLQRVASLLEADESKPIPELSLVAKSVRVWEDSRLRPNAIPVFNGYDETVWPEMNGYRH
jgi:hypothetical protein